MNGRYINQADMNRIIAINCKVILLCVLVFGLSGCKLFKKNKASTTTTTAISEPEDADNLNTPVVVEEETPVKDEVPERNVVEDISLERRIDGYFGAISSASSVNAANNNIQEALSQFSNPSAPVLIIFYKGNGQPSYDEPTTIEKYLNYLKDTKKKPARVEEMVLDERGKIKELVLLR